MSAPISSSPNSVFLWELLKTQQGKRRSAEQGLTIMECLVAILLIGLTVAMVTPPLLIATATRVQNRRAEQAIQIAQDEVDRINTLVQQGQHQNSKLPNVASGNLGAVAAPSQLANFLKTTRSASSACSGSTSYSNQQLGVGQALRIDIDGDCTPDFFMQVFRTAGVTTEAEKTKTSANQRPAKFDLGVRVYSVLAEKNITSGKLEKSPAPLSMTNTQGKQDRFPLVTVYKPIAWGEQADVLCESVSAAVRQKLGNACPSPSP